MDDFALFLSVLGAILGIIWFAVVYLRIKDIRDDIRMIRLLMQGADKGQGAQVAQVVPPVLGPGEGGAAAPVATPVARAWFVAVGGLPSGPYSAVDLEAMLRLGEISPRTWCCRDGDAEWSSVGALSGEIWPENGLPKA